MWALYVFHSTLNFEVSFGDLDHLKFSFKGFTDLTCCLVIRFIEILEWCRVITYWVANLGMSDKTWSPWNGNWLRVAIDRTWIRLLVYSLKSLPTWTRHGQWNLRFVIIKFCSTLHELYILAPNSISVIPLPTLSLILFLVLALYFLSLFVTNSYYDLWFNASVLLLKCF